jgi:hypothetical protein
MLALLLLVWGVAHAVQAAVLISNPEIGASFTNPHLQHLFPRARGQAAGALGAAMIAAVVSCAIGAGLWFLQDWARWGLLLITGIPLGRGLIAAAITLATSPSGFIKCLGGAFWFPTLICGAIVLYITRKDIQCAFTGREEYFDPYDSATGDVERKRD